MGNIKGFKSALEALRALDTKTRERILGDILKADPAMAKRLRSNLVVFEDLLKVDTQGITRLFQEIPETKWVLALRGKKPEFVDRLLKKFTKRKADLLKAALTQQGPQPLEKVEATQREIIEKALSLQSQGLLIFVEGDDPLV